MASKRPFGPHSSKAIPITFIEVAGPAVYWPLLDFGTLDAIVDVAELQAHELFINYKQTILTAVQQVDDAVASYAAAQQRLKDLDRALVAARRSTKLATERYDRGLTDYLNVLDAERKEFDLEEQYVSTQKSAAEELIALCKALGGGWERHEFLPPLKRATARDHRGCATSPGAERGPLRPGFGQRSGNNGRELTFGLPNGTPIAFLTQPWSHRG